MAEAIRPAMRADARDATSAPACFVPIAAVSVWAETLLVVVNDLYSSFE